MCDYIIDPFFGKIFINKDRNYASCGFLKLTSALYNRVSPESFTSHLRRVCKEYNNFTLKESHSNDNIRMFLEMLDPSQVDLVKIYSWEDNYKFFGIEFVFIDCLLNVISLWTFDGSHENELIDTFLNPIQESSLAKKTIVQSWLGEPTFTDLTAENLQLCRPKK